MFFRSPARSSDKSALKGVTGKAITPRRRLRSSSDLIAPLRGLTQERRSTPQDRRLPVQVAGEPLAIEIVLQIVLLARALANVAEIGIRLEISDQSQPSFARRLRICFLIQPSVLDSGNHGERKH